MNEYATALLIEVRGEYEEDGYMLTDIAISEDRDTAEVQQIIDRIETYSIGTNHVHSKKPYHYLKLKNLLNGIEKWLYFTVEEDTKLFNEVGEEEYLQIYNGRTLKQITKRLAELNNNKEHSSEHFLVKSIDKSIIDHEYMRMIIEVWFAQKEYESRIYRKRKRIK